MRASRCFFCLHTPSFCSSARVRDVATSPACMRAPWVRLAWRLPLPTEPASCPGSSSPVDSFAFLGCVHFILCWRTVVRSVLFSHLNCYKVLTPSLMFNLNNLDPLFFLVTYSMISSVAVDYISLLLLKYYRKT